MLAFNSLERETAEPGVLHPRLTLSAPIVQTSAKRMPEDGLRTTRVRPSDLWYLQRRQLINPGPWTFDARK